VPGNVDRERDLPGLRFEQFLAGAVGVREGLAAAGTGPIGEAFETAVGGMAGVAGTNTQFGALLLLVPLVRTATTGSLDRERAVAVVEKTTAADAAAFYRAFEHVEVAVDDPPPDVPDARRGADAAAAVEERDLTLSAVLARGADDDGVAAEWTDGFSRSFAVGGRIADWTDPLADRAAQAFLVELAREPATLDARRHGEDVAAEVTERAAAVESDAGARAFAEELVEREINPGTTADIVAAGLFVALERGVSV
jgi:triphosphoribosyl-dephospho-CoA synthase